MTFELPGVVGTELRSLDRDISGPNTNKNKDEK